MRGTGKLHHFQLSECCRSCFTCAGPARPLHRVNGDASGLCSFAREVGSPSDSAFHSMNAANSSPAHWSHSDLSSPDFPSFKELKPCVKHDSCFCCIPSWQELEIFGICQSRALQGHVSVGLQTEVSCVVEGSSVGVLGLSNEGSTAIQMHWGSTEFVLGEPSRSRCLLWDVSLIQLWHNVRS